MALNLTKGDKLNLEKSDGRALTQFCVGLNWGVIVKQDFLGRKTKENVDLDASAALFDANNQLIEIVYFAKRASSDGAIQHSGDDVIGDTDGDDGLDNEIITVNLTRFQPKVDKVVFILNSFKGQDFATIPYAHIRIYEGTPERVQSVFATFNIAADAKFKGFVSMIMGKLYKRKGVWKFETIGEPTKDRNVHATAATAQQLYI